MQKHKFYLHLFCISLFFGLISCNNAKSSDEPDFEHRLAQGITGDSVTLNELVSGLWREYSKEVEENYVTFTADQKVYLSRTAVSSRQQLISSHDEQLTYTAQLGTDGKTISLLRIAYGSGGGSADYGYDSQQKAFIASNPSNHISYRKISNDPPASSGTGSAASSSVATGAGAAASTGGAASPPVLAAQLAARRVTPASSACSSCKHGSAMRIGQLQNIL